jgi:Cytochrome C'
MNRFALRVTLVAVLALGIGLLPFASSGFAFQKVPGNPALQKDIRDLAKDIAAGKPTQAKVAAIKGKFGLDEIMELYKPQAKGGIGASEGIEFKLRNLGKKALTKDELAKLKGDLIELANINLAISAVARPHFPGNKNGKKQKDWEEYSDATSKSTMELIKAVKGEDAAAVKKIADNINASCSKCHADFRD